MPLSYTEVFCLSCLSSRLLNCGEASFVRTVTDQELHLTLFQVGWDRCGFCTTLETCLANTSALQTSSWVSCVDQDTLLLLV